MNETNGLFDINEYLDYKTGQFLDPSYDKGFFAPAVHYNSCLVKVFEKHFLKPKHTIADKEAASPPGESSAKKRKITVDDLIAAYYHFNISTEEKILYCGSYEIFSLVSKAQDICDDEYIALILDTLSFYLDELIQLSVKTDSAKIAYDVKKISKLKEFLCRYSASFSSVGSDEELKQLIGKILNRLPYIKHCLGIYNGDYTFSIFTKPIASSSNSPESFNSLFWSTFSHEMFHTLHHYYCKENNLDSRHWKKDDSHYEGYPRPNTEVENIFDQHFTSIVKESLASYFEYYSNLYGVNSSVLGAADVAYRMRDEWMKYSPLEWPYAGAKAFLADGDSILNPDSLFRTVLDVSAHDWHRAQEIILENC